MSKLGKVVIATVTLFALGLLLLGDARDAAQAGDKDKKAAKLKLNAAQTKKLAIVLNKTDPEIKAAQKAISIANADLKKALKAVEVALADEVLGETTGVVEAKAIVELQKSRKSLQNAIADCNLAAKHANIAQFFDTSGN